MNKQLFTQTAPPPLRGRGRGCGAERRQWRMQRGGAPVAVEKIEQASSAKIFSGTARRWGQMRLRLPLERICAQYGFRFFAPEKSKFVASTAKRQEGLSRGKPGPPLPCFASFCRSKRKAPAASGANYAFAKGSATPLGDHNLGLIFLLPTFLHRKAGPRRAGVLTKPCKRLRPAARCPPTRPKIPLPAFISFAPGMHGSRKNRPTVFPLLRGRALEFAGIRAEHLSDHGKSSKSPAVSGERFCWTGPVRPL